MTPWNRHVRDRHMIVHHPDYCLLGKQDAQPNKLQIASYWDVERAVAENKIPTSVQNSRNQTTALATYLNTQEGDCTCAAIGNILRVNSLGKIQITDQDVQAGYVYVTNQEGAAFDPQTGANDNGCIPIDVLDYWAKVPGAFGGNGILGHAGLNIKDSNQRLMGAGEFGSIYMGVQLDVAQQTQQIWDYVANSIAWGGHLFPIFDINPNYGGTWGQYKQYTDNFIEQQADEGHVVITDAWVTANAENPLFDVNKLVADLKAQYQQES